MTTNQGTNQDSQLIEETLNRTDLGHIINENKKIVLIFSAIVIVGLLVFSVINHQTKSQNMSFLDEVYEVNQSVFQATIDKKMSVAEFKNKLTAMDSAYVGHPNLVLSYIEALNALGKDAYADDSLLQVSYNWRDKINKSNPLYLFMQMRVAVLEENLGKLKEAASTYELLIGHQYTFLKDKILAELVRVYTALGDSTKAAQRYKSLKKDFPDSQYTQMAQLYLKAL